MRKIFLTFLVLGGLGLHNHHVFADVEPRECLTEQYCSIENETRVELDLYVESNTTAIRNLTDQVRARATQQEPTEGLENFRKYIIGSLNNSVDWRRFDDIFDFYVLSAMNGTMPTPIYRDYEKLANEGERIQKLTNILADGLYDDIIITNSQLCAGINTHCSLDGVPLEGALSILLGKLYENNLAIRNYYYLAALGREDEGGNTTKIKSYFFIPSTGISGETDASVTTAFQNILSRYYGADAIAQCNQCKGGSFKKIKDSINNIAAAISVQESSYKSWKDAWYLLIGGKETSRKVEKERELLERELSRQGIKTENAEVILQNLDDFNNPENEKGRVAGFTWGNNYISNTIKSIVDNTDTTLDAFESTIQSEYNVRNETTQDDLNTERITTDNILKTQSEIDTSVDIAKDIQALYNLQLEHAQKDSVETNKLVNNIVGTHNNLVETIDIMNKTIPISEEVCNSQASGLGTCTYGTHK